MFYNLAITNSMGNILYDFEDYPSIEIRTNLLIDEDVQQQSMFYFYKV